MNVALPLYNDMEYVNMDYKEIQRIVTKQLKNYKVYKVALQNKEELARLGILNTFPVIADNDFRKSIVVKQIDRVLNNGLNDIERELIERRFLAKDQVNDITVYMDMGIRKDQYYIYKKEAIKSIALALGMI